MTATLRPVVPWPTPASDDTPVMAAVAADLGDYWQVLEQVRELLGTRGVRFPFPGRVAPRPGDKGTGARIATTNHKAPKRERAPK